MKQIELKDISGDVRLSAARAAIGDLADRLRLSKSQVFQLAGTCFTLALVDDVAGLRPPDLADQAARLYLDARALADEINAATASAMQGARAHAKTRALHADLTAPLGVQGENQRQGGRDFGRPPDRPA